MRLEVEDPDAPIVHNGRELYEWTQSELNQGIIKHVLKKHLPWTKLARFEFSSDRGNCDTDCVVRVGPVSVEVKFRQPSCWVWRRAPLLFEVIHRIDLVTAGWAFYSEDDYLMIVFHNGVSHCLYSLYRWNPGLKQWFDENFDRYETTEKPALNTNLRGVRTETRNYFVPLEHIPDEVKVIESESLMIPDKYLLIQPEPEPPKINVPVVQKPVDLRLF